MSAFTELMVYAQRRGLRIALVTNASGRETRPDGRIVALELLSRDGEALEGRYIAKPGTSVELDHAAGELLAWIRERTEEDGA